MANTTRAAIALACMLAGATAHAEDTSPAFDGRWGVTLVCEDTHAHNSFAKGYTFNFVATVSHGVLDAQYGIIGKASSLTLKGKIEPDGAADIFAQGLTGHAEFAVGHPEASTAYSYHMSGTFKGDAGRTRRLELRACSADFARLP